ncbi:MAG: MbnP family protein [Bacteroidia bacterium]
MKKIYFIILVLFLATSCTRNNTDNPQPTVNTGNLVIQAGYRFDNSSPILFDSIMYTNAANFKMSISRMQYYLSGFVFYKSDGSTFNANQVAYFDAKDSNFSSVKIGNIPFGDYTGLSFYLGVDPANNISNKLPTTAENINMAWPDLMGGGYHFIRLEGNYIDTTTVYGFALHVGKNANLVTIPKLIKSFSIGTTDATIQLKMNISEWFKNPAIYDFDKDGNFSMGDSLAMRKLMLNGTDVFN